MSPSLLQECFFIAFAIRFAYCAQTQSQVLLGDYNIKEELTNHIICGLKECRANNGEEFENCYKDKCNSNNVHPNLCIKEHCTDFTGFLLDACAYAVCAGTNSGSEKTKRMAQWENMVWPDEFETKKRDPENLKHSAAIDNCTGVCHGFTGITYKMCVQSKCSKSYLKSLNVNLAKRWSGRLCMEAHCKSAGNKAAYFMCGQKHCN